MSWHAIVPFKAAGERKTRLAGSLSVAERDRLSESMFAHAVAALRGCAAIADIAILSPERPADWCGRWIADAGLGLNAELQRARAAIGSGPLLVLHADLPGVADADVTALLQSAEQAGAAFAADRHGTGTNAVALFAACDFAFAFGPDSLRRHREQRPAAAVVRRAGLALDIDTPDDMAAAGLFR